MSHFVWMRGRRMVNNTYELRLILNALPAKQIFLVALLNLGGQVCILRPNPLVLICIRRRFNKQIKISRPMRFLGTHYRELLDGRNYRAPWVVVEYRSAANASKVITGQPIVSLPCLGPGASPGPFLLQLFWTYTVPLDFCFSATDVWLKRVEKNTLMEEALCDCVSDALRVGPRIGTHISSVKGPRLQHRDYIEKQFISVCKTSTGNLIPP
jgi:hypothetical protein